MDFEAVALFALTEFLLSMTPGPAVLLVVGLSMRKGFGNGFAATAGILSVNAIYFALSALGVGALILASATLFTAIKWAGAAYLAYLGIQMLRPLLYRKKAGEAEDSALDLDKAASVAVSAREDFRKSFWRGFILQAANPKIIVFFVAILPQFISPEGNVAGQLAVFGVVSVLLELPILAFYGLASAKSAAIMKQRVVDWVEGISGGILIMMGWALALYRRAE